MRKFLKKLIYVIIIFVLSIFYLREISFVQNNILVSNVLGETYNVEPGERIDLPNPSVHKQFNGILEGPYNYFNWLYDQGKLNQIWNEKGSKTTKDSLCYITVGGVDYILVAVSPIFGTVGDYIKVHVNHDGEEKDYYMMICDIKSPSDSTIYRVNNIPYGHTCGPGRTMLNVLEFPYNGNSDNTFNFTKDLVYVDYIINGGNYFENPDGPIGFDTDGDETNESNTFAGACGNFFRQLWDGMATFMDNSVRGKNKSTSLYALNTYNISSQNWVWPYPGCSAIASYFGPRPKPTAGASTNHKGIDIGGTPGDIEVAAKSGTVTSAQFTSGTGYCIKITADDTSIGTIVLVYMHCAPDFLVNVGDHVYAGQPIAKVGPHMVTINGARVTNGPQTGPHLHFEVRINGTAVNPLDYVQYTDSLEAL